MPAKPRKSRLGRLTYCTGKRNGRSCRPCSISTVSRCSSSVGPAYQGMFVGARGDVVAKARRHRDRHDGVKPRVLGKHLIVRNDLVEDVLRIADQIDLVDGNDDVADAEQRGDEGMPAGLLQHALARVDQHDGEVGRRGAGRHVAGVLLVAGRVGDDELALRRREEAIGDIDGDALLALGFEPVDQQREIDVVAVGAVLSGVALKRRQLVFEDQLGVVEQAADQRRLAVIDRAAGQEAQQRLVFLLGQIARRFPDRRRSAARRQLSMRSTHQK